MAKTEKVNASPVVSIYASHIGFIVDCHVCGSHALVECEDDCDDNFRCAAITAWLNHAPCAAQSVIRKIAQRN